jgi:ribosomal protein L24
MTNEVKVGDTVRIVNEKMKWCYGMTGEVIGVYPKRRRIGVYFEGMYTPSYATPRFAFEEGEWEKVD